MARRKTDPEWQPGELGTPTEQAESLRSGIQDMIYGNLWAWFLNNLFDPSKLKSEERGMAILFTMPSGTVIRIDVTTVEVGSE